MRGQNTIVINGKVYDALTGLPVAVPSPAKTTTADIRKPKATTVKVSTPHTPPNVTHHPGVPRTSVHRRPQRSVTLRRDILAKPVQHQTRVHHARTAHGRGEFVQKSPMVSKFAPHPKPLPVKKPTPIIANPPEVKAQPQPVVPKAIHRVHALQARHQKPVAAKAPAVSSKELKEKLISERLAAAPTVHHGTHLKKSRSKLASRQPRLASVITACFALVVLGGYFTYLNMPGLSVRVAAAQAGVEAHFPEYRPDGYSLSGPVSFAPGEVSIGFKSNGGTKQFTLNQSNSTWDSQAVLDNYVAKQSDSYLVNSEQGLTVYTYDSNAAWVNGGVLYTIEGDAPLTTDQILNIAASL